MSVTNQARLAPVVEVSQSNVIYGAEGQPRLKGIRCDQAGVLTYNLNDSGAQTANLLQGEVLSWTGKVDLSTDATCRLTVELL